MQTFLPYPDFFLSAECLDYRRLGKQRVEAFQLLKALKHGTGWSNHPAAKMWKGCERALGSYMNVMILEWKKRGYKNTMELYPETERIIWPSWWGDRAFHDSHKSNLLRKDPVHYAKFKWEVPDDLPYVWPKNTWAIG